MPTPQLAAPWCGFHSSPSSSSSLGILESLRRKASCGGGGGDGMRRKEQGGTARGWEALLPPWGGAVPCCCPSLQVSTCRDPPAQRPCLRLVRPEGVGTVPTPGKPPSSQPAGRKPVAPCPLAGARAPSPRLGMQKRQRECGPLSGTCAARACLHDGAHERAPRGHKRQRRLQALVQGQHPSQGALRGHLCGPSRALRDVRT